MESWKEIGSVAIWAVPAIVAVAAFVKYCIDSRIERGKKMLELMREFLHDHSASFYSFVERKDHEFYKGDMAFCSTEDERRIDSMLLFLESVLHFRDKGIISNDEFTHFEYYLKRIISDPDFSRYLYDFGMYCSDGKMVNPFVHILQFSKNEVGFVETEDKAADKGMRTDGLADGVSREDALCVSEEAFVEKLKSHYHGMTRTAKSVKSRVDNHLLRKGWSYANPPTKSDLLKAIKDADADVPNADVAASVRSALRQYYRASFGEEPNV